MFLDNIREIYSIQEVADSCNISRYDIKDFALHEKFTFHVWVPKMAVFECEQIEVGNQVLLGRTEKLHEGYLPLYASDVRKLLKYQKVNIRAFPNDDQDSEIHIHPGSPDIEVFKSDIVILKSEAAKLKTYLKEMTVKDNTIKTLGRIDQLINKKSSILQGLQNKEAYNLVPVNGDKPETTYDELFQSVYFKGEHFSFGPLQAEIIKLLHQATLDGHPRVHFKILLEKSGAKSLYMRDVFKGKDNWQNLILSDKRGYYWLHKEFVLSHTIHKS